jgi:anti-anti-sigma factor
VDYNSKDSRRAVNHLGTFLIETSEDSVMRSQPSDKSNISEERGAPEKIDIVILKISGTIDLLTSSEFQKYSLDYILKGFKYFLLDFTKLDFIDSMGLSTVLMLYQKICEAGGVLTIINPKPSIMVVLKITKVNQKILVFNTIDEAKAYVSDGGHK